MLERQDTFGPVCRLMLTIIEFPDPSEENSQINDRCLSDARLTVRRGLIYRF
jgi:hypothetical protein